MRAKSGCIELMNFERISTKLSHLKIHLQDRLELIHPCSFNSFIKQITVNKLKKKKKTEERIC